ncbi:hypothetical protein [Deinococcus aluminii]|uniref:Uncharacterized protein n=1 Tax=Deinococcus aluminii TaxID=1656885 RepID=A0ABP9XGW0_9DEIO
MLRVFLLLLALLGTAQAQFVGSPTTVTVRESPSVSLALAARVLVQPARPEVRVGTGQTTALLTFSLLSEVATEVRLSFSDPRRVMRGDQPRYACHPYAPDCHPAGPGSPQAG